MNTEDILANAEIHQQNLDKTNIFLTKTFSWMFSGLLLTALTAFILVNSNFAALLARSPLSLLGLFFIQIGVVVGLSNFIHKINTQVAAVLFIFYSILSGITITPIIMHYTNSSIATTFIASASMFAIMAAYGYFAKQDLSKFGSIALMGLIGIIIGSLVNIFFNSEFVHWFLTYAGITIFLVLTAYDMQKLKSMSFVGQITHKNQNNLAIVGALSLYLDFINLFLLLLRIFGGRK